MSSLTTFRALCPALANVDDDTVTTFLGASSAQLNTSAFGNVWSYAVIYHAAHELVMAGYQEDGSASLAGPSVAGGVTQRRAGDVSESYGGPSSLATVTQGDAYFHATAYGRKFLQLRDSRPAAIAALVDVNA